MKVRGFAVACGRDFLRAECDCCDCPAFVDEPDFSPRPATTGAKP